MALCRAVVTCFPLRFRRGETMCWGWRAMGTPEGRPYALCYRIFDFVLHVSMKMSNDNVQLLILSFGLKNSDVFLSCGTDVVSVEMTVMEWRRAVMTTDTPEYGIISPTHTVESVCSWYDC